MYSTPGALVDQRRRVFVKSPIEAWGTKRFEKREGVAEWPLFCQVDTSTQSLKVRSQMFISVQYPSFTVYQHTVAHVLALLCKHIRHLNIEASGRTWD